MHRIVYVFIIVCMRTAKVKNFFSCKLNTDIHSSMGESRGAELPCRGAKGTLPEERQESLRGSQTSPCSFFQGGWVGMKRNYGWM